MDSEIIDWFCMLTECSGTLFCPEPFEPERLMSGVMAVHFMRVTRGGSTLGLAKIELARASFGDTNGMRIYVDDNALTREHEEKATWRVL